MMEFSTVPLAAICLMALALVLPSHAQNAPLDYLNAHNAARGEVGVGPMTWNDTIASYALNYSAQHIGDCELGVSGGPYGENVDVNTGDLSGTDAVKFWVAQKAHYNPISNSCDPGQPCGVYTQVVWRNSIQLGCAKVRCNSGGTLIRCNYYPPGNVPGQKPY